MNDLGPHGISCGALNLSGGAESKISVSDFDICNESGAVISINN